MSSTCEVSRFLVLTLNRGDIVIADNLGGRKGKPVRDALNAVGAKPSFLPAYGPGLNPIEMMCANLKTLLRKADERSVEATCSAHSNRGNALHVSAMPGLASVKA